MKSVVEFFNPKPIVGVLEHAWAADTWRFPEPLPTDREPVELVDVGLLPSGHLVLTLRLGATAGTSEWIGLHGVHDADDGSVALELGQGRFLVFPARERERVTALFLKLASRQY